MGKVYLAEQKPLGRLVALKIMTLVDGARNEEFRQRFMFEASISAQLNPATS